MYLCLNIVPRIEELFNELGTLRFNAVLVCGNNIIGKTPREREKLGRNRRGHLKASDQKLIIFKVSPITFYLNYVNKARVWKSRK